MSKEYSAIRILSNIDNLFFELMEAHSKLSKNNKNSERWYQKKGKNLISYLRYFGLWDDERSNKSEGANYFINFLKKEIKKVSSNKLNELKIISTKTLFPLQTGDILDFNYMPSVGRLKWPSSAAKIILDEIRSKK